MAARTGCCNMNLAKIDPSTGAVIWKKVVKGANTRPLPPVVAIVPLRGTNDVLVAFNESGGLGSISRVDGTGAEAWNSYADAMHYSGFSPSSRIGADGSNVCAQMLNTASASGLVGLDYSGAWVWSTTQPFSSPVGWPANFGGTQAPLTGFQVSPGQIVTSVFSESPTFPQIRTAIWDAATGASTSTSNNKFFGQYVPLAIEQSSGNWLILNGGAGNPLVIDPSYATVVTGGTSFGVLNSPNGVPAASWGPAGISVITPPGGSTLKLIDPTTLNPVWSVSTLAGSSISSFAGLSATDNDSSGSYFATDPVGTPDQYNLWKFDGAGSPIWANLIPLTGERLSSVCVADDGWLYVGV